MFSVSPRGPASCGEPAVASGRQLARRAGPATTASAGGRPASSVGPSSPASAVAPGRLGRRRGPGRRVQAEVVAESARRAAAPCRAYRASSSRSSSGTDQPSSSRWWWVSTSRCRSGPSRHQRHPQQRRASPGRTGWPRSVVEQRRRARSRSRVERRDQGSSAPSRGTTATGCAVLAAAERRPQVGPAGPAAPARRPAAASASTRPVQGDGQLPGVDVRAVARPGARGSSRPSCSGVSGRMSLDAGRRSRQLPFGLELVDLVLAERRASGRTG